MGELIILLSTFITATLVWMSLGYFLYEVLEKPYVRQEQNSSSKERELD